MTDYKIGKNVKRMIKDNTNAIPSETRLAMTMHKILVSYYYFNSLPDELTSDSALKNLRTMEFIRLLLNDIILGLCMFRDDDNRSLSFDQVVKDLKDRKTKKDRIEDIKSLIEGYKQKTKNLENHRNSYIAHNAKSDKSHLKPTTELYKTIQLAVQITDKLSGQKNQYLIEDIDLRQANGIWIFA